MVEASQQQRVRVHVDDARVRQLARPQLAEGDGEVVLAERGCGRVVRESNLPGQVAKPAVHVRRGYDDHRVGGARLQHALRPHASGARVLRAVAHEGRIRAAAKDGTVRGCRIRRCV